MPVFIPWAPAGLWTCGVAGEEDTAGAVAGGVAVMEAEVGQPDRVAQPQAAAGERVGDRL